VELHPKEADPETDCPRTKDPEARRIATELAKLHGDKAFNSANNPRRESFRRDHSHLRATYTGKIER
jgi:hypothetical protein